MPMTLHSRASINYPPLFRSIPLVSPGLLDLRSLKRIAVMPSQFQQHTENNIDFKFIFISNSYFTHGIHTHKHYNYVLKRKLFVNLVFAWAVGCDCEKAFTQ